MSRHRDDIVLQDILNAARLVVEFVRGFDKGTFLDDWKTRSAVLYQLTVIGEAVKRLSAEFPYNACPDSLAVDGRDARSPCSCIRLGGLGGGLENRDQ